MKFVVDVNLSPKWLEVLHRSGFEAIYWTEIGESDAADEVIMEWARGNNAHVPTTDLDFGAILAASGAERPSVVQFRPGRHLPDKLVEQLISAVTRYARALENGALITINQKSTRLRILPISSERLI